MQKTLLVLTVLFLLVTLAIPVAIAQDATKPAETSVNEVTENIRERLQETIGGDSTSPERLYGYVGTVKDIIKNTIVIEDKEGKKNVQVSSDSKITRSPGNADIKIDNIRIDDNIIAIGKLDGEEVTGTKLIVSADSFAPPKKISGLGKISKQSKTTLTIATSGDPVTLDLTSKTVIKSGKGVLESSDLNVGDELIYAGTDVKGDLTATILYLIKSH